MGTTHRFASLHKELKRGAQRKAARPGQHNTAQHSTPGACETTHLNTRRSRRNVLRQRRAPFPFPPSRLEKEGRRARIVRLFSLRIASPQPVRSSASVPLSGADKVGFQISLKFSLKLQNLSPQLRSGKVSIGRSRAGARAGCELKKDRSSASKGETQAHRAAKGGVLRTFT